MKELDLLAAELIRLGGDPEGKLIDEIVKDITQLRLDLSLPINFAVSGDELIWLDA